MVPSIKTLADRLNLCRGDAQTFRNNCKNYGIDKCMELANDLLRGYGVEPLRASDHFDNYWGDIVALYVNMGDTYTQTILCDVETGNFYGCSWGDWVEAQERKKRYSF